MIICCMNERMTESSQSEICLSYRQGREHSKCTNERVVILEGLDMTHGISEVIQ